MTAETLSEHITACEGGSDRLGDWFQTWTGKRFYILDPRVEDFCIEDVAHALSNQCRYNGHTDRFYSVAEHSIILTRYVLNGLIKGGHGRLHRNDMAHLMLMHDGAEAYFSDVPKPIKNSIPNLEAAELRVEEVYAKAFGTLPKLPNWMKEFDRRIVMDEKRALMIANSNVPWAAYDSMEPLGVTIVGYEPKITEQMFLDLYEALRP